MYDAVVNTRAEATEPEAADEGCRSEATKGKGKGKDAWLLAMRGLGFEPAIIDDDSSDIDDGFWGDATDEVQADNQLRADARTAERGARGPAEPGHRQKSL